MANKRKITVYSAGCPACQEVVEMINNMVCSSCEVEVLDMHDTDVAQRAKNAGVQSVPAVAVNGVLADCCQGRGPDKDTLQTMGIGQPLKY